MKPGTAIEEKRQHVKILEGVYWMLGMTGNDWSLSDLFEVCSSRVVQLAPSSLQSGIATKATSLKFYEHDSKCLFYCTQYLHSHSSCQPVA